MHPKFLEIDIFGNEPWVLHSYGLLIAVGFLSAMMLAKRQGEREGEDPDRIVDLAFYLLRMCPAQIVYKKGLADICQAVPRWCYQE